MSDLKGVGPGADASELVDFSLKDVWQAFVNMDIPAAFCEAKGPLPPVLAVTDVRGAWDSVGASRVLCLGDGNTVREEVLLVEAPRDGRAQLVYEVTGYAPPFDKLTQSARGLWQFEARGDQTLVRWSYAYAPTGFLARPVLGLLNVLFWKGYMRDALGRFAGQVSAQR